MAGPKAGLQQSRWAIKTADAPPPAPLPQERPQPVIAPPQHRPQPVSAPPSQLQPQQTVSDLRRKAAASNHILDEEIEWESDCDVEQEPESTVQWPETDNAQGNTDDSDIGPIEWESSSDEGELSEGEVTEDDTTVASTPTECLSPQNLLHLAASKSLHAFVPKNPVQKFQGSLGDSQWATTPAKETPKLSTIAPLCPAPPAATLRPSAPAPPQTSRISSNGLIPRQPVGVQQPLPPFNSIHPPPPVYPAAPAAPVPPHTGWISSHSVVPRQFVEPAPTAPLFVAPSSKKPTFLDYKIDPAISSLIGQILGEFGHLTQRQNMHIECDDDEYPEYDYHKCKTLSAEEKATRNEELRSHAKSWQKSLANTRAGAEIKKTKLEMSVHQQQTQILQLIKSNAVVVIAAATGSGKTTQLPQIILDDAIASEHGADCNIFVTQPRRVAARTVAKRVRKERFDGGVISVGHHVKFEVQLPKPGGCITYCTTGILLNRIQRRPGEVFENVSHIIVDEVHERDMIIDRLLAMLKWHLFTRKRQGLRFPKIILSSATLDIGLFTEYFAQPIRNRGLTPCPYLDIPGRMFPVEYHYLGDILEELQQYDVLQRHFMKADKATQKFLDLEKEVKNRQGYLEPLKATTDEENAIVPSSLIALTVAHLVRTTTEGAILVFLPGLDSIQKVKTTLEANSPMIGVDFNDTRRLRICILHGEMKDEQDEAFDVMPKGCRKIVLSTNIAETSVTIPDAVYVIDSGKHKEKLYDPSSGLSPLKCGWVSKSSCKQRAGRSGRVQNGFYYAIYSRQRAGIMRNTTLPEILRSDLQEVCLQIAHQPLDITVRDFLDRLIEPPDHKAVDAAFDGLKDIDALTDDEKITSLGRVLASLPVHPALAKMIVLGIVFRCLDPMLILASASNSKGIFQRPREAKFESRAARMRFSDTSNSDHLALIKAFDKARLMGERQNQFKTRDWMRDNYISFNTWKEVCRTAEQIEQTLIDRRLIKWFEPGGNYWKYGPPELNVNSGNENLVKALIVAGFHPNVAATTGGALMRSLHVDRVLMTNQSVNVATMSKKLRGQLYTFSDITKSQDGVTWQMRDNSTISPLGPIIFGRNLKRIGDRQILVDGWLQFFLPTSADVTMLLQFKNVVDNVLADAYAQLGSASKQIANTPLREKLARLLGTMLFQDVQAYEYWLEHQPIIPQGPRKRRKNRKNRGLQG